MALNQLLIYFMRCKIKIKRKTISNEIPLLPTRILLSGAATYLYALVATPPEHANKIK